eukprot:6746190-Alexandrium_andersonii.AAC.1
MSVRCVQVLDQHEELSRHTTALQACAHCRWARAKPRLQTSATPLDLASSRRRASSHAGASTQME